ncbi:M56 family peptidase, partial [Streptomyces endophyticus]|nr:M56 family peptidase [Streptomyces endophyticus]
ARAALAGHTAGSPHPARPDFAPAATTGPVPQRVTALLAPAPHPRAARWIAVLLACCAALSVTTGAVGAATFHHNVEVAQGEEPR